MLLNMICKMYLVLQVYMCAYAHRNYVTTSTPTSVKPVKLYCKYVNSRAAQIISKEQQF